MNERLKNIGLETQATTFHKLGKEIIRKNSKREPAVTNENTLNLVINDYLKNHIFNNQNALQAYIEYVACFMNIPEENDSYGSLGEKIDVEKGINLQTLKSKAEPSNNVALLNLDTFQGEKVKSVEELTIANFLYLHGIEYEYEKPYPNSIPIYRPDFYLTDYDIWLEHFGVDENGEAKWLPKLKSDNYVAQMHLKIKMHEEKGTKLLKTYSYLNREKILLPTLEKRLKDEGVVFKPRDTKIIYQKIAEKDEKFGKEIIKLIESFINLGKSRRLDEISLQKLFDDKSRTPNDFMRERQQLFLKFALPILAYYDQILASKPEIDFNDMINRATDAIEKNQPDYGFKYIIIDEYQDISFSRFNLVKEIRDLCGARLICVGDDWQSIYRFAGSDVSLFHNFGKFVGQHEKLFIEQTFRNSQNLIDISAKFVQKNKAQIAKNPKSKKEILNDPVKFVEYGSDNLGAIFLEQLKQLVGRYGEKSILVLGRHSFDIDELLKVTPDKIRYIERTAKLEVKGFENVDIKFLTVHKSKGLEADNVIVLNLKNHLLGFPNKMTDDPILSLLLNDAENYRFAEERRLFYVALTRTRNEAILMVPTDVSLFAEELLSESNFLLSSADGNLKPTNCPYCRTGKLKIRINTQNGKQFLGCSHYPICNETFANIEILENSILCKGCDSGFMVKRLGRFGDFLGCTSYPKCTQTINLSSQNITHNP